MPPTRASKGTVATSSVQDLVKKVANTRLTKNSLEQNLIGVSLRSKRKADGSPKNERIKRSALGNLTNAALNTEQEELNQKRGVVLPSQLKKDDIKKVFGYKQTGNGIENVATSNIPLLTRTRASLAATNIAVLPQILTRAAKQKTKTAAFLQPSVPLGIVGQKAKAIATSVIQTVVKTKDALDIPQKSTRRISNEFEQTEDESLYVSALEEIPSESSRLSLLKSSSSGSDSDVTFVSTQSSGSSATSFSNGSDTEPCAKQEVSKVPYGVVDFDKENWNDPFQVSHYTMDIFNYLRKSEINYPIIDYIDNQPELSKWMRSLLIDWMVEVQESFELNHETLYLAVKIVDTYLGKTKVSKDALQLLGAASLLIACKFDERTPPLIDDFLYICDGAYKQAQLIKMETNVFKTINFDLGIPLSYRFLRRYARCGKVSMVTLTLARYILEYSLMDYATIQLSDSKMACAALFIALKMNNMEGWNSTFEYYSGYKLEEFAPIVVLLNTILHRKPKDTLSTVRNKYSHSIFHQVTKIKLLDIHTLLDKHPEVAKKLGSMHLTYTTIISLCSSASQPQEAASTSDPKQQTRPKVMPTPQIAP